MAIGRRYDDQECRLTFELDFAVAHFSQNRIRNFIMCSFALFTILKLELFYFSFAPPHSELRNNKQSILAVLPYVAINV